MRAHTSGRVTSFVTMREMQCAGVRSYNLQSTMWAMQCVPSSRKTYLCQKRLKNPIKGLDRPWEFQELEAPRFQNNRHMKVVRLSALRTGCLYPRKHSWYSFLLRDWVVGKIMSMKNFNDTMGNRTRELPDCSAVPQPTASPAACPTQQTFMPTVGFEPTISEGKRPQTYTLDRAATGTGFCMLIVSDNNVLVCAKTKGCLMYVKQFDLENQL
jgi:hypothetical protein